MIKRCVCMCMQNPACFLFLFYLLIYYLFILALPGLSCGTQDLCCIMRDLLVAACGLLSCSMWTLSCGMHAGSSSLTRDRTQAPCIGSTESYPLDQQGSPPHVFYMREH